jgi:hypothetical protein
MRTYEPECVPGLLQTEDYARAIMRGASSAMTDDDVERHVAVRLARQARLTQSPGPQLWAVIGEGAIRCQVGGAAVMRLQLARLLEASHLPNVTLQIMPFAVGAHAGLAGAFLMLSFAEAADQDVVYVNYSTGSLFLEKPEEVERSALIFNHLRAAALSIGQSREMVSRTRQELA